MFYYKVNYQITRGKDRDVSTQVILLSDKKPLNMNQMKDRIKATITERPFEVGMEHFVTSLWTT
jgi:hypothetical protein